jgi:hypothetical protein
MTVNRVKIDGTASSPFRVSVSGVDVDLAEFNTLIFDGNQSPLRLWATGYITITGISDADFILGKNVNVDHTGSFPTPSGTAPVFMTMWRWVGDPNGFVQTPTFGSRQGAGGGVCSGAFVGANFHAAASGVGGPGVSAHTNYCIFKNYN